MAPTIDFPTPFSAGRPEGVAPSGYHLYLWQRVKTLTERRRRLPVELRDHPFGRLLDATIEETLVECDWAGIGRDARRWFTGPRPSVSA